MPLQVALLIIAIGIIIAILVHYALGVVVILGGLLALVWPYVPRGTRRR